MIQEGIPEVDEILLWFRKTTALASRLQAFQRDTTPIAPPIPPTRDRLVLILHAFQYCVGYLEGRRIRTKTMEVASESAVQDLLFVMIKPVFPELTFEDPSPKSAASYAIKDLYFPSMKLVLEAKYVGRREDVKAIEKQLNDDIMKYTTHPDCEDLVFFIYDPHLFIADRYNFAAKMSRQPGEFVDRGKSVRIQTIITP